MVAVLGKQVVGGALEGFGSVFDNGVDFVLRGDCEAVQDLTFECASRWLGAWLCPVYAGHTPLVMTAVSVFFAIDHYC